LTAADGRNITVSSTTAGGESTGLKTTTNGAASALVGILTSTDTITINGVSVGAVASGAATAGDQTANIVLAINALKSQTGVEATATLSLGTASATGGFISLSIASGDGRGIEISGSTQALGRAGLAAQASSTTSKITLSTNGPNGIVLGGSLGLAATGQVQGYSPSVLMSSGGVDLSTANGSQAALSVLDKAINTVTDSRASMGAYQNRLTASVANLEVTSMNLQASRSRILDTDYAKETTKLAKSQIIQQAATAMLAQANQSAQSVLALLK
jgi:flagellin